MTTQSEGKGELGGGEGEQMMSMGVNKVTDKKKSSNITESKKKWMRRI